GKLIVVGKDRHEALVRMEIALDETIVEGIRTTIPFHRLALKHPRFQQGDLDTHFVAALLESAAGSAERGGAGAGNGRARGARSASPGEGAAAETREIPRR